MKLLVLLLVTLIVLPSALGEWDQCELPTVEWITHDDGQGRSMGYALTSAGTDVWVAGTFRDRLIVRGNGGSIEVNGATDDDDTFLAKIRGSDGTPTSAAAFGGSGREVVIDAFADAGSNKVAVCGYFLGNISIGSQSAENGKEVGSGDYDGFVALFDLTSGAVEWLATHANDRETKLYGVGISGSTVAAVGYTCKEDVNGAIDPTTGRKPDVCVGLVKTFVLSTGAGADSREFANVQFKGLSLAATGLVATGDLSGALTVSDLGGHTISPVGAKSAVVVKLATSGLAIDWLRTVGASGASDSGWDVDVTATDVFVSGYTQGSGVRSVGGFGQTIGSPTKLPDGSNTGMMLRIALTSGQVSYGINIPSSRGIRGGELGASVYLMGLKSGGFLSNGHSLGSYDVFVAKVRASDGFGLWYMDIGGGDGLEYPWSLAINSAGDLFVSGLSRSTTLRFGDEQVTNLPADNYNMFVVKIKASAEAIPTCKTDCATLKADTCFIGNQCFEAGNSPFADHACYACAPASSTSEWTGPNLNSFCEIDGKCVADGAFKGAASSSPSECEFCDASKSTSDWTLHSGYLNTNCDTDSQSSPLPGCGTRTRNTQFCSADKPCYDSTSNDCHAAVSVCAPGYLYTDECSNFPAESCYDLANHRCVPPNANSGGSAQDTRCGQGFIKTDQCPATHPCFDHSNLVCVPFTSTDQPSAAPAKMLHAFMLMLGLIVLAQQM